MGTKRFAPSLPTSTPWTATAAGDQARELAGIRLRGLAFAHQEYALGLVCLAAPIFGRSEQPPAALAISGPIDRFIPSVIAPRLHRIVLALSCATRGLFRMSYCAHLVLLSLFVLLILCNIRTQCRDYAQEAPSLA